MINDREITGPSSSQLNTEAPQVNEQERLRLYKDVLYREATSLLVKYLPEALPQEPTQLYLSVAPRYEGKFKGTHYVSTGSKATTDLFNKPFRDGLVEFRNDFKKHLKEVRERSVESWNEEMRKLREQGQDIPDDYFRTVEEYGDFDESEEGKEGDNWDKLTGSLKTREGYSVDTWQGVMITVHELIHQRQEELNPTVSPELSSPELEHLQLENTDRSELPKLIREASIEKSIKAWKETRDSIYWPVIEGMSVVGSFYVMASLENDLLREGNIETATKVRRAKSHGIFSDVVALQRNERNGNIGFGGNTDYSMNYVDGFRIMRKLYKQFGKETPRFLAEVDFKACLQITKGSSEYQQIMENPTLLPGLSGGLEQ